MHARVRARVCAMAVCPDQSCIMACGVCCWCGMQLQGRPILWVWGDEGGMQHAQGSAIKLETESRGEQRLRAAPARAAAGPLTGKATTARCTVETELVRARGERHGRDARQQQHCTAKPPHDAAATQSGSGYGQGWTRRSARQPWQRRRAAAWPRTARRARRGRRDIPHDNDLHSPRVLTKVQCIAQKHEASV
jgi:hypothetical protein